MMKHKLLALLSLLVVFYSCSKDHVNEVNLIDYKLANKKSTGRSSNDILSDDTYKSIIIEVVYVEGFKPTETAINNFVNFLKDRTYKPNGISIETRAISSPGNSPYTNEEIRAIEDNNRTLYNNENQIAVWAFFADGESADNTENGIVLGTAYRNTSFVIYEETLHGFSNSTFEPNRSALETTVITHEFGHILGLTNLGTNMVEDHEDTEHEKHCINEDCLMYWATTSGSNLSNLMNSPLPQLGPQCIADLQANGGK